jgi:K+-sensing histidine kinase KdpD
MDQGNDDRLTGQGTYFAPAERAAPAEIAAQLRQIVDHPVITTMLASFCGQVLVLNRDRQILAASAEFREALQACGIHTYLGLRPGEALLCEHMDEGPAGCGTSRACQHCGAVMAILAAQACLGPVYDECWITMRRKHGHESVELRAKATPLCLAELDLVVLALQDISDQKRRGVLEHRFLHDARNLLGGVITWSELIASGDTSDEASSSLKKLALELRDLISEHGMLARAERGDLLPSKAPVDLDELARALREEFARHPRADGRHLDLRFFAQTAPPTSDATILLRILSNMVKNAVEATPEGGTVQVIFEVRDGAPRFSVHNSGVIPDSIAQRIFQRSFTTKDEPGHGLGTYSMRLLAERYLDGQVVFESSEAKGTIFCVLLPRS